MLHLWKSTQIPVNISAELVLPMAHTTPAAGSPFEEEPSKASWQADFDLEEAPPPVKESLTSALGRKGVMGAGPDTSDTEMVDAAEGQGSHPPLPAQNAKSDQSLRVDRRKRELSLSNHPVQPQPGRS